MQQIHYCKQKIVNSELCAFCHTQPENINHLFFICSVVRNFWNEVVKWLQEYIHIEVNIKNVDFILGKRVMKRELHILKVNTISNNILTLTF